MRLRVADEGDLEATAETLARAFEHEPIWNWPFASDGGAVDRERKLAALRAIFGFCAAAALDYGWVRVTDGVEAVAVWIPPGEPEMSSADAERLLELVQEVCDEPTAARILTLFEAFERNHLAKSAGSRPDQITAPGLPAPRNCRHS